MLTVPFLYATEGEVDSERLLKCWVCHACLTRRFGNKFSGLQRKQEPRRSVPPGFICHHARHYCAATCSTSRASPRIISSCAVGRRSFHASPQNTSARITK